MTDVSGSDHTPVVRPQSLLAYNSSIPISPYLAADRKPVPAGH